MAPGGMAGRALVCPPPLGAQPGVPGRGHGGAGQGPAVALPRPADPLPPTSACSAAPGPGHLEASPPRLGRPPSTSPRPQPQGPGRGCSLGLEPSFSRSSRGYVPLDLRLSSHVALPLPRTAAVLVCTSGRCLLGPVARSTVGVLGLRCSPTLASCLSAHPWEHKGARNPSTRSPTSASSRPGGQNSSQTKALPRDKEESASIRPTQRRV